MLTPIAKLPGPLSPATFLTVLLLIFLPGRACAQTDPSGSVCGNKELANPYLTISTQYGAIEIELYESAAPGAVRRVIELVEGPIFNPAIAGANGKSSSVGYYDGLTFNYTRPHQEIATAERPPEGRIEIETEIDARSLGLDRQLIENSGEAMTVMQRELLVAHRKKGKKGDISAQMNQWLEKWKESYNADFLIGVSEKEINEALGYSYKEGLDSRPVTKGSVGLRPATRKTSSPRLTLFLEDIPEKTGKWMVIGRIVSGLDLADEISISPLVTPRSVKPRQWTPLNPVKIDSIKWSCRK